MSLLNLFRRKEKSAEVAKDRLKIILAHERTRGQVSRFNLAGLQQKIIKVISEHLHIQESDFKVDLQQAKDGSKLELNVMLPEEDH